MKDHSIVRLFLLMLSRLINLVLMFTIGVVWCTANPQSWRGFSPPHKQLIIELPEAPKLLTLKDERLPSIFPGSGTSTYYSVDLKPGGLHELFFGFVNLSKHLSNRRFDQTVNGHMLWIAGDDKHFSKEVDLSVGGLHGREFVFTKGDMSGRALFLNGGNRVYLLMYSAEGEGSPKETLDRIFDSFHPLRTR